jgi:sugar-specific transcriptional regulator TrmB
MLEVLEKIGLGRREAMVYAALIEIGQTTTGPLVKRTGIPASKIYETLNRLISKGLVSFVMKEKTKHFSATNPERLVDYVEEKKKDLEKQEAEVVRLLPYLKERRKKGEEFQGAEVAYGFEGFRGLVNKMIADAKKGDEYLFLSFYPKEPEKFKRGYAFYEAFDRLRKKKGLDVKGLIPENIRGLVGKRPYSKICYVDFPIPLNISICGNKVLFTPWEEEEVTYIVYSRQLAKSFREYFYSVFDKYYKKKEK